MEFKTLQAALNYAKSMGKGLGKPYYVVRCFDGHFDVVDVMPLMGEWWTIDGIKHG